MAQDSLDRAADLLRKSRCSLALTGAGASTESHIPDFRGRDGLWSRYDPMEYGTIGAFRKNPAKVWRMLATLLETVDAEPNGGHRALAALEERGLLAGVITQNIDGLHRKGGSRNVLEFHGSLDSFSCLACGESYAQSFVNQNNLPPRCRECSSILKPDIVFYDERIPIEVLGRCEQMLAEADLLLVAGTSCRVQPAAQLPYIMHRRGGSIIELNREPVLGDIAAATLAGNFSTMMEGLLERLA